jgi:hypothetical protein
VSDVITQLETLLIYTNAFRVSLGLEDDSLENLMELKNNPLIMMNDDSDCNENAEHECCDRC